MGNCIDTVSFFITKNDYRIWRKRVMAFFQSSVTGLKVVVTAIGAGVAVWGIINLLKLRI